MEIKKYFQITVLFLSIGINPVFGQSKIVQKEMDKLNYVSFAKFATDTVIPLKKAPEVLKNLQSQVKEAETWSLSARRKEIKDDNDYIHQFYQQHYKGIKVDGGEFSIHAVNDNIESVLGNFESVGNVDIRANLSEEEALKYALKHIGAEVYKWQIPEEEKWLNDNFNESYIPKGELVIVKDLLKTNSIYRLAYKFDIYAHKPMNSNYIWVDAINGEIINVESRIHFSNSTGTAATRYSGTRTITTDSYNGGYRLRETRNGVQINTYNMNFGTNANNATDFVDNDNNWTAVEYNNANRDNAALDAHWGAEMVYEYFKQIHNRNSWNGNGGAIISYVNADMYSMGYGTDNAFWSSQDHRMVYGYGTFSPLTALDICAHEIGHGVCQSTVNLGVSATDKGAINESLSDIWGACVENWATANKQTWLMGEDLGSPLRNMSNPNLYGDPDTYQGNNWYTGSNASTYVHTNSGVGNFWFYLLSQGGTGTNDLGNAYAVTGIGIEKAAKIVYKAETSYLTSSADYTQFRNATVSAATNIYGANTSEVIDVTNAWYAVGVGNQYVYKPTISGSSQICGASTYTLSNLPSGATVTWQITPSANASVSNNGLSATVTPLMRGTFTLTANINSGMSVYSATKSITAGANTGPYSIMVRDLVTGGSPLDASHVVDDGSPYYFELHPPDPLITKYEWIFSTDPGVSYYWNSFSYPYTVGGSAIVYDSISRLIRLRAFQPVGPDIPITDPPASITVLSRFRDCFGWSDIYSEVTLTVNYPLPSPIYSAAYPNPANSELIIDRETNSSAITGEQNAQAKNSTAVKVLLYSHSAAKLVYSKDFSSSEQQITVDTSKLPNGIYYLNIIANGEKIKQQTIVVSH